MSVKQYPNLNYLWGGLMVEELIRNGVTYFCIAPGSRSSPLTVSVANNQKAKSMIHFDERGLAFHALGVISATKKPCAIITTSGTALANLFPAVIEASKKKLPLIILTADRPPELRQTGAHQTIDQVHIFGSYTRWHMDVPTPTVDIDPTFVLTSIDQAVSMSQSGIPGPVHLNCMFREPLAPIKGKTALPKSTVRLQNWMKTKKPFSTYVRPEIKLSTENLEPVIQKYQKAKQGIIVVGKLSTDKERKAVEQLSKKLNWPIFADLTSRLRLGNSHTNVIHYFDQVLLTKAFNQLAKVDAVIHLGGRITSKRWYQFIEQAPIKNYLMVLNHPLRNDPLHMVTDRIHASVEQFCQYAVRHITKSNNQKWLTQCQELNKEVAQHIKQHFSEQVDLTEPETARLVSQLIKKDDALFLANSLPLREMDMYADTRGASVVIGSNRGASGIDGTIASAIGFSEGLKKDVTLLIGDLAFLYDLNSLPMLKTLDQKLVIVILNNNGGGIFSFLPIVKQKDVFEQYFGTPHNLKFKEAAKMFGLEYCVPKSKCDFVKDYKQAQKSSVSTIIEVKSNRQYNFKIHQDLNNQLKKSKG